jgi:hypothetical protein
MIEPSEQGEIIPDVAWEIRMKCNKETKITYGPWADRQRLILLLAHQFQFSFFLNNRELLWQYFLPTLYEDSPITPEPSIGHTRIFKFVRFKLTLNCLTKLDFDFKKGKVGNEIFIFFIFQIFLCRKFINFILNVLAKVLISMQSFHSLLIPMVSIHFCPSISFKQLLVQVFHTHHFYKLTMFM